MNCYQFLRYALVLLQVVVFVCLLGLKLDPTSAAVSWSWWWITAPLYAPLLISLSVLLLTWLHDQLYYKAFPKSTHEQSTNTNPAT